ncbi:hydrophobin 1 [Fusarium oxysporum f. sp. albedinis]|nr:hydrophobin 1 [Fusarium oxysporum f. sp. albedinis]
MHPVAVITFLTTAVSAGPQIKRLPSLDKMTVAEANDAFDIAIGNDLELLDDISTGHQCSELDIDAISIANQLLNNKCQANAACC